MVRRNLFRLLIVTRATASAVAVAVPAYAAEPQILAANDLPTIISNITTWIVGLLIGVATLFLTIGGLRYLAAGGDPTEVEKAKSALKSALKLSCATLSSTAIGGERWLSSGASLYGHSDSGTPAGASGVASEPAARSEPVAADRRACRGA